jgi:hypothetical protein
MQHPESYHTLFVNIVPMVTPILVSKILLQSRKCYLIVTFILQYAASKELSASFLNKILNTVLKEEEINKQKILSLVDILSLDSFHS